MRIRIETGVNTPNETTDYCPPLAFFVRHCVAWDSLITYYKAAALLFELA